MANPEHLEAFCKGPSAWLEWKRKNQNVKPDLSGANFSGWQLDNAFLAESNLSSANLSGASLVNANLCETDLRGANLDKAILFEALLFKADLAGASLIRTSLGGANLNFANLEGLDLRSQILNGSTLQKAKLHLADLSGAQIIGANLTGADLSESNLAGARLDASNLDGCNLSGACLAGAILKGTALVEANLCGTDLSGSFIYGVSAWDLQINDTTKQHDLVITPNGKPVITVDNIKVAQFIYLLLDNQQIRDVIDTITSKAVLILGRFSDQRKPILDTIREELRKKGYLPIMFDFKPAQSRDTVETIRILAAMAKFVLADLTDARSVLQELQAIAPSFPSVPLCLMIKKGEPEPGMLDHIRQLRSGILEIFEYEDSEQIIRSLEHKIIRCSARKAENPAEIT